MPSDSFYVFKRCLSDVQELIKIHDQLKTGVRGKQRLKHVTRSGIVMLCASWEIYNEELVKEGVGFLCKKLDHPNKLPMSVQKTLASNLKSDRNDLKLINMSGDGWKDIYCGYTKAFLEGLHTPKSAKLKELFDKFLGVENVTLLWPTPPEDIDDFVSHRGAIAHGNANKYVQIGELKGAKDLIVRTVINIDSGICDYIQKITDNLQPWKKTYK